MTKARPGRRIIGIAQLLLVVAAGVLWAASRTSWVVIRSFDGLGPPKSITLSGGTWSTALLPLAVLQLAGAVAVLAVRGWALRALAALLALVSFAVGYLGVSLWAVPDVAVRGADLAHISLVTLVGTERHYWGAAAAVLAAVCTLIAAVILMRAASHAAPAREGTTKYASPGARRSAARSDDAATDGPDISERAIWDALDEGRDPTDRPRDSDTEGRL